MLSHNKYVHSKGTILFDYLQVGEIPVRKHAVVCTSAYRLNIDRYSNKPSRIDFFE